MTTPKFCTECGAPTFVRNDVVICTMKAEHNVEAGGFHCPDCGDHQSGDDREGARCPGCATPY